MLSTEILENCREAIEVRVHVDYLVTAHEPMSFPGELATAEAVAASRGRRARRLLVALLRREKNPRAEIDSGREQLYSASDAPVEACLAGVEAVLRTLGRLGTINKCLREAYIPEREAF